MRSAMRMTKIRLSKYNWYCATLLYMALLVYVSVMPADMTHHPTVTAEVTHNLCHVPAYGILFYLLLHCFANFGWKTKFYAFLIASSFGTFNEFLQSFVPSRQASFSDMLLNATGAIITWLLINKRIIKI